MISIYLLLFFPALFFQISLIHALPAPLSYIPVMLILGIVIMHRTDEITGMIWFAATWILFTFLATSSGAPFSYLLIGITGALLMQRVFSQRSIYALIGLGLALSVTYGIINVLFWKTFTLNQFFYTIFFVMVSTGVLYYIARYIERVFTSLIYIRGRSSS